jgi:hypothetical protein
MFASLFPAWFTWLLPDLKPQSRETGEGKRESAQVLCVGEEKEKGNEDDGHSGRIKAKL